MVKLMYLLRRRPGMSREEFREYWEHRHAVTGGARRAAIRSVRYVQNHRIDTPLDDLWRTGRSQEEPFDGVVESWFESIDALQDATSSAAGRAALVAALEDEARFIDLERSMIFMVEEVEFPGTEPR